VLRRAFIDLVRTGAAWAAVLMAVACSTALVAVPASAVVPTCGASTVTVTRVSGPVLYLETGTTPPLNSAYAMYKLTNSSGSAYTDLWVELGSFSGPRIGLASSESGIAHPGALANGASANASFYLTATAENLSSESHALRVYTTRPDLASAALCTATFMMTAEEDIAASANKVTSVTASSTPQLGGTLTVTVVGDTGTIGAAGKFTATPASYSTWPANAYRLAGSRITMTGGNTGVHTDVLYFAGLNSSATDYTAEFTFAVVGTTATSTSVSPMTHISSGTQVKHTSTNNFTSLPAIPAVTNRTTLSLSASPPSLPSTGGTVTYTVTLTNTGSLPARLDDLIVTLPAGVTYVPGSSTYGGTPVADPTTSGNDVTYLAGLTIPATGTRTLTLQGTVPGTPGNYAATVVGHVASVVIDTTLGTGDTAAASAGVTVAGPPPTVTSINPTTGTADGGTLVTISGTNFTGATQVRFGAATASFTVDNDTTITATTPAGSGAVDVTVTTPSGTSSTGPQDVFTYGAPSVPPPSPSNVTSSGQGTTPQTATITVPSGGSATLLDANSDPAPSGVTVTGQGTYTLSGGTITFTPVLGYTGTATPVTYRVTDQYQRSATATYTPTVNPPAPPSAANRTSTGVGTAVQSVSITLPTNGTLALVLSSVPVTEVPVGGKGTFAVSGTTLTFTPLAGFSGNAAATYRITDAYTQSDSATYTATVTLPPPPTAPDRTTSGVGTIPQSAPLPVPAGGTIVLLDSNGNAATELVIPGMGKYTLVVTSSSVPGAGGAPGGGVAAVSANVVFEPELGYTGTAPAIQYRVTDAYGQSATATYTPTVTLPAAPPAPPQTSIGNQTNPQQVTLPVPAGGSVALIDGNGNPVTTLVVPGEGTYTLNAATGALTFTPLPQFSGSPTPVTYQVTDAYGQTATATYAPAVVAADALPATGLPLQRLAALGVLLMLLGMGLRRVRPSRA
jgi:uncharacterized repeat protein (TIGR01451 family)